MSRVKQLVGPQVTDLYVEVMEKIDTLRVQRRDINSEIRELLDEAKELRKFVRLFDPAALVEPAVEPLSHSDDYEEMTGDDDEKIKVDDYD